MSENDKWLFATVFGNLRFNVKLGLERGRTSTMEKLLEYLISVGIIGFGVWIIFAAAKTGSDKSSVLVLLGLLPIVVGSISLYGAIKNGPLKA